MKCLSCGVENPVENKFCGGCGELLMVQCSSCEHQNPASFKFCEECGTLIETLPEKKVSSSGKPCPLCQHTNAVGFKFCEECGTSLEKEEVAEPPVPPPVSVFEETEPVDITPLAEAAPPPVPEPEKKPQPKPVLRRPEGFPKQTITKPKPVSTTKQESPTRQVQREQPERAVRPARKIQAKPKPKQKKKSFLRRVVLPLAIKAATRFVVSSVTGFLLGKVGLLIAELLN